MQKAFPHHDVIMFSAAVQVIEGTEGHIEGIFVQCRSVHSPHDEIFFGTFEVEDEDLSPLTCRGFANVSASQHILFFVGFFCWCCCCLFVFCFVFIQKRYTEAERSSDWQPWYSLQTLKLVFNVSSEYLTRAVILATSAFHCIDCFVAYRPMVRPVDYKCEVRERHMSPLIVSWGPSQYTDVVLPV